MKYLAVEQLGVGQMQVLESWNHYSVRKGLLGFF